MLDNHGYNKVSVKMEQKRERDTESQLEMTKSPKLVRTSSDIENAGPNKPSKTKKAKKPLSAVKSTLPAPELSTANFEAAAGANTSSTAMMSLAFKTSMTRFATRQQIKPSIGARARLKGAHTPSPLKKRSIDSDDDSSPERIVTWDYEGEARNRLEQRERSQVKTQELTALLKETLAGHIKLNADLTLAISKIAASCMALLPKNTEHSVITNDLLGVLSGASLQQLLDVANLHCQALLLVEEQLDTFDVDDVHCENLLKLHDETLKSVRVDIEEANRFQKMLEDSIASYHQNMTVFCNYFYIAEQHAADVEVAIIEELSYQLGQSYTEQYLQQHPTLVRMLVEQASLSISMSSTSPTGLNRNMKSLLKTSLLTDALRYEHKVAEQEQSPIGCAM